MDGVSAGEGRAPLILLGLYAKGRQGSYRCGGFCSSPAKPLAVHCPTQASSTSGFPAMGRPESSTAGLTLAVSDEAPTC